MKPHNIIHSDEPVFNCVINKTDLNEDSIECVAEETPIAMVYNGISHVVMMASPDSLKDFAIGFSITENIVNCIEDIYSIEIKKTDVGIELDIDISTEGFNKLKDKRRNLIGRTGCGLCGSESLDQILKQHNSLKKNKENIIFSRDCVLKGLDKLSEFQNFQKKTGATHGAALCNESGDVLFAKEDVGRHNALDKLIGNFCSVKFSNISSSFIIISSRASYEMIQKSAAIKVPLVVAISAPTALAIRLADKLGITLIGFARGRNFNIYTHKERIK